MRQCPRPACLPRCVRATKGVGRMQPVGWGDCADILGNDELKGVKMPNGPGAEDLTTGSYLQYNEVRMCFIVPFLHSPSGMKMSLTSLTVYCVRRQSKYVLLRCYVLAYFAHANVHQSVCDIFSKSKCSDPILPSISTMKLCICFTCILAVVCIWDICSNYIQITHQFMRRAIRVGNLAQSRLSCEPILT